MIGERQFQPRPGSANALLGVVLRRVRHILARDFSQSFALSALAPAMLGENNLVVMQDPPARGTFHPHAQNLHFSAADTHFSNLAIRVLCYLNAALVAKRRLGQASSRTFVLLKVSPAEFVHMKSASRNLSAAALSAFPRAATRAWSACSTLGSSLHVGSGDRPNCQDGRDPGAHNSREERIPDETSGSAFHLVGISPLIRC